MEVKSRCWLSALTSWSNLIGPGLSGHLDPPGPAWSTVRIVFVISQGPKHHQAALKVDAVSLLGS